MFFAASEKAWEQHDMQWRHSAAIIVIVKSPLPRRRFYQLELEVFRMGNDNLSLLSPGLRRGTGPTSPSFFNRRNSVSPGDTSWRTLGHRHKFLLYTLGILTVLCSVYLYFAITWGASDACSGLGGAQRVTCQLRENRLKAESMKGHHRRFLM